MCNPGLTKLSKSYETSALKRTGRNSQNNSQTRTNQTRRNETNEQDRAPRGRELAADDVVLGFEVTVEAEQENEDCCTHTVSRWEC